MTEQIAFILTATICTFNFLRLLSAMSGHQYNWGYEDGVFSLGLFVYLIPSTAFQIFFWSKSLF
jgi:hypothetical protein